MVFSGPISARTTTRHASRRSSSRLRKVSSDSKSKSKSRSRSRSRSRGRHSARSRGQAAPTPDRIKEIQSALKREGAYDGEPTGRWDAATIDAMKKYQDNNGFPATGKIDALSLKKLGLGSDTAGKGAPLPVAPAVPAATHSTSITVPSTSSTATAAAPAATAPDAPSTDAPTPASNTSR
ncbi:MAG: peptidoglycan-binding domain-containing protein [Candidatus Acidiferrales bacterium]